MKRRYYFFGLIGLVLAYFLSRTIVNSYENPANSDFFSFWLSGKFIINNLNPYSAYDWIKGHHLYDATWISDPTFLYPLPLSILFIPFGLVDFKTAFIIWVMLTVIFLIISISLLLNYLGTTRNHLLIPVMSGVILFRPLNSLLLNGQLSTLFLLIFVLSLLLWEKENWLWGGVVITFALLKPNIGLIVILLLWIYLFNKKRYHAIVGTVCAGLSLLIFGEFISPGWIADYFSILMTKHNQTFGYSPTIWGLSFLATGFNSNLAIPIGWIISCVSLIAFSFYIFKSNNLPAAPAMGLAIIIMELVTPYIWPYDQIILIIPIILIAAAMNKSEVPFIWISLTLLGISICSYILFGISARSQLENINGLLPVLILVIYILTVIKGNNYGSNLTWDATALSQENQ